MCDTIVIVEPGRVLFAKNSDRDANEGQNLVWNPRRSARPAARLQCTYIEIPEVDETYATLLSQPFWIWGAEMGTNEHGVTIGNEAVFTREPQEKRPGLIGMDLLRLGLERADSAKRAVEIITALLEKYGQGGGCGHESKKFTYHNSFIVADPREAFVLETAGRKWSAEPVQGARTISNGLTIPEFQRKHSDLVKTHFSGCRLRKARTQELAESSRAVSDLMRLLSDHGPGREHPHYAWTHGGLNAPCVHGGGILTSSQTTGSWVAELSPAGRAHWATGTAAPCVSLFKPVSVDQPVEITVARDVADDSLWWRHEKLHRRVMRDPARLRPLFIEERDDMQRAWLESPPESAAAFAEADELLAKWTGAVAQVECRDVRPVWTQAYWKKRNRRAGLDLSAKTVVAARAGR
jgi:dipeptidase